MPKLGGFSPLPLRLGGGKPRVETITRALAADRGTALDTTNRETVAYVETHAVARALSAAWGTNERLGHLWDPWRMSEDILARWERIFAIRPAPEAKVHARRRRLAEAFAAHGRAAIQGELATALQEAVGAAFVAVEAISYSAAHIVVPDGTYPWGSPGDVPWSSNVAHVLVRLQKPAGWTDGQFYAAAARVDEVLDDALPAWATFNWYRPGETSSEVPGGASAAGFYLDEPANLDNQVFRV